MNYLGDKKYMLKTGERKGRMTPEQILKRDMLNEQKAEANTRYIFNTIKNDENKKYGLSPHEVKKYLNIMKRRDEKFIKHINEPSYIDDDDSDDDDSDDDENPIPEYNICYPTNIYDKFNMTYGDAIKIGAITTHKTLYYILEQHEAETLLYIKCEQDGVTPFKIKLQMEPIFKTITDNEYIERTTITIEQMRKKITYYGINKTHLTKFKDLKKKYKGVYFDIRTIDSDILRKLFINITFEDYDNKSTLLLKCGLMYDFINEQWYTHRKHIKAVKRSLTYILGYNDRYNHEYTKYTEYNLYKLHEITDNPEHIYISDFIKENYLIYNTDISYEKGTAYKDKYISKQTIKRYMQELLNTHGVYNVISNIIIKLLL